MVSPNDLHFGSSVTEQLYCWSCLLFQVESLRWLLFQVVLLIKTKIFSYPAPASHQVQLAPRPSPVRNALQVPTSAGKCGYPQPPGITRPS